MAEQLMYRLFQDDDLPGVLRLWAEESGWGGITEEQWRRWYRNTPYGDCLVTVALDQDGAIVGQEVFTPVRVVVDDVELAALRISAPIIRHDARQRSLRRRDHPVVGLYLTGAQAALAAGYRLMYTLPEHAWLPMFRWWPTVGLPRFAIATYDCLAAEIAPVEAALLGGAPPLVAQPGGQFGSEHDALWQSARAALPIACGAARTATWLRYKNSAHLLLDVRDPADGALVGYAAIKKQTGLLADLLARDAATLPGVLAAVLDGLAAARQHGQPLPWPRLQAMATPLLAPALRALGFAPVDYQFAFTCTPLDPTLTPDTIAPERWYVTPGD